MIELGLPREMHKADPSRGDRESEKRLALAPNNFHCGNEPRGGKRRNSGDDEGSPLPRKNARQVGTFRPQLRKHLVRAGET